MPSPINHRDITLTEHGRGGALKHSHDVRVHLDTVRVSGATCELRFTDTSVTPDETSRHALEVYSAGTLKGSIFWDIECVYGAADTPGKGVNQYLDPTSSGGVTAVRPSTADLYDNNVPGGWGVKLFTWKVPSGWTVTQTRTNASNGATWTITVKQGTTVKYSGALAITVSTQSFLSITALSPKDRERLYGTGLISPADLQPGPTRAGKKTTTKKAKK